MKIAKSANHWLLTLMLGAPLALTGCPTGTGGDDDDSVPADDDDVNDDDDVADDDDGGGFEADGLTFNFRLESTATDVGDDDDDDDSAIGDDDDSAGGDDDDSAEPPANEARGFAYTVTTEFQISYWVDIMNGIPNCDQIVTIEGEAWFGTGGIVDQQGDAGSCDFHCTGYIKYDFDTIMDITNPDLDPDHCTLAELQAVGADYGARMLGPADPNATPPVYGDFLTTATMDFTTHDLSGLDVTVSTEADRTAAGSETEWLQYQLQYSHTGFTRATPQSLAGGAGLDAITRPPHDGSDYLGAWEIFLNPMENTHDPKTNIDMQGVYGGSANYILTLGTGG